VPPELLEQLRWLRGETDLPLCVGFGVSKPEHVRTLRDHCDGVIVGSALVRLLEGQGTVEEKAGRVAGLARSLAGALA
jgi:tryptophan synthase alpha chain